MKKTAIIVTVSVFVLAFAFGALAPTADAAKPKVIKDWYDCFDHVEVYCELLQLPGVGTWTECNATGFTCAF